MFHLCWQSCDFPAQLFPGAVAWVMVEPRVLQLGVENLLPQWIPKGEAMVTLGVSIITNKEYAHIL